MASLGTFTPPDATVDVRDRVTHATVTERALWSDALVSESTVQVRGYRRSVSAAGHGADGTAAGNDARQLLQHADRTPTTFQLIQTASGSAKGAPGCTCSRPASIC